MPPEIAPLLRSLPEAIKPYTPASLGEFFALPELHFHQRNAKAPIQFHQAGLTQPTAYILRGTVFWPADGQIVRGCPRVQATSDYATDPAAVATESAMFHALKSNEAAIEVNEPGITMRLYSRSGAVHFATDAAYDASNPLTAAGIDNARALGIDYAGQAMRLLEGSYRSAAPLARLGYVPVFSLLLPERESVVQIERPDLVLVDVIDPDHCFVDRLEKERIAEDYGLHVSTLQGRMQPAATPTEFYSRLRSLEHIAARDDVAGYVVKVPWRHDQLAVKVETPSVRQTWTVVDEADMKAVFDAVCADFGSPVPPGDNPKERLKLRPPLDHSAFLTAMMLEYLDNHNRSVRWQVTQWLERTSGP